MTKSAARHDETEEETSLVHDGSPAITPVEPIGAWPSPPDVLPSTKSRFTLSAPRHFVYPAILLLLAEQPRHGYGLASELRGLGLGSVDRPSIYRALADLERDGLVRSWDEPPTAGSTRHVHAVTATGVEALEAWMSVVAQERASLDLVLQRYWYCNAHRLAATPEGADGLIEPGEAGTATPSADEAAGSARPVSRIQFELAPDRSNLVVEARSNIGPIAFSTTTVTGWIEVHVADGLVATVPPPAAHLETRVTGLTSGNALYDAELLRRIDARRFPTVTLDLVSARRLGVGNCYQIAGNLTMHGVTRCLGGSVTATLVEGIRRPRAGTSPPRRLSVAGEHVLDIRHFDMEIPSRPLLKLYPDVRLHLHLEADGVG